MHVEGEVLIVPAEVALLCRRLTSSFGERLTQLRSTQAQRRSVLESSTLCAQIFTLGEGAQARTYQAGETIFTKGDPSHSALLIQRGSVDVHSPDVTHGELITERLFQGQIFGERSLLRGEARLADVTAHEEVELLEISAERLNSFAQRLPHLTRQLEALRRFERLPNGVIVIQYHGEIDGQAAIITVSHLSEGISIIGSLLVSTQQYQAQLYDVCNEMSTDEELSCPAPEGERRDLWLHEGKITRIETLGVWSELSGLQGLMLSQEPLAPEWMERLLAPPVHTAHDTPLLHPPAGGLICSCMQLSHDELMDVFHQGARSVAQLMEQTGVGTCCGGCVPSVAALCQESIGQRVVVSKVIARSSEIFTLQFVPESGGHLSEARPGQHIIVSLQHKGGWISRPYTLTTPLGQTLFREVTIKRLKGGALSQLLSKATEGDQVWISEPKGTFTINAQGDKPAVFFAAGIGVTPALSFAYAVSFAEAPQPLLIHHCARHEEELTFNETLQELSMSSPQLTYLTRVTSREGRLTRREVKALVQSHPTAEFYLCGPLDYLTWLESSLRGLKVEPERIHVERFHSFSSPSSTPHRDVTQSDTLARSLGWVGVVGYLAQDLFELRWPALLAWQSASSVRLWTGLTALTLVMLLWSLARAHSAQRKQRYPWLDLHRQLGALAPLLLFVHASDSGHATLFALSLTYLLATLSGLIEPSGRSSSKRVIWLGLHISLSLGLASLLIVHIYTVVAFQ